MGMMEETFPISCKGGLDNTTNTQDLLAQPNLASRLINFEPSSDGGYRRVSGQEVFGSGVIQGGDLTPIKGLSVVDGKLFIVCQGSKVYVTYDKTNYVQVNKDITDGDYAGVQAATELPRPDSVAYKFTVFQQGLEVIIMGVSDGHPPFLLKVSGTTLADSTYTYKEVTLTSGSLTGAFSSEKFKDQYVIAGMTQAPSEIYYSDINATDDFEGGNAGSIGFNDIVKGMRMFRGILYVFCETSIHKVIGLETGSPAREEVTAKIGCIDGNSIQELVGDLIFLSPDGLRSLSATVKIGDVNLELLSKPINSKLEQFTSTIADYTVVSEVIKSKSQYRLFFRSKASNRPAYSIILRMGINPQTGGVLPQFSELQGFDVHQIHNGLHEGKERTISGDKVGNLWYHDSGIDMNGTQINFLFQTPFFSAGDPAVRKNVHKLLTYLKLEGDTSFNVSLKFDFDDPGTYQPPPYSIGQGGTLKAPALYGTAAYANVQYGTLVNPRIPLITEGSGKVIAIRIFPSGERCDPFSLQGFDMYLIKSGRI